MLECCLIVVVILQLQGCNRLTRALILSIAVCYYAKLQCRDKFEEFISPLLISSPSLMSTLFSLNINVDDPRTVFKKEIVKYVCIFLHY